MTFPTKILIASLCFAGFRSNAAELLSNGSFERPITEELTLDFRPDQQHIPGWKFFEGASVVNHTRLLPGEGFQSLLLPSTAVKLSSISQQFEVPTAGTARISFKVAASKATDGEVVVAVDNDTNQVIRLSQWWKPEEIALTDQMLWRSFKLPEMKLAAGSHTLSFQVLKFQPRNDRQGDTRWSVQGILIDDVSVQTVPFKKSSSKKKRKWPEEKNTTYPSTGPLPLDAIAGPWVNTRTLACYPSIANFFGALRSTKELGGLQYLHFADVGGVNGVINALSLDGQPILCDASRWYPYQLRNRVQVGPLNMETTTRMVFEDHGVLTRFTVTNQSSRSATHTVEMNLQTTAAVTRPDPRTVIVSGTVSRVYRFTKAPDQIATTNGQTFAVWEIALPPHGGSEISVALVVERDSEIARQKAERWGSDFNRAFAAARTDWDIRWQAVFTPDNDTYSGCLPTLETKDRKLRELYYLSIASMLEVQRENFPKFKQCFVGEDPEWGGDLSWFWDYSLTARPFVLLNPDVVKNEMRHWLTIDWRAHSHFSVRDGSPRAIWYAVNAYAYFLSLDCYFTLTGDFAFLSETIKGKTVLDHMEDLAMDWKRLVPQGGQLMDIGGNPWNMLEAPPDYIHSIASLNAANVWMMRRLAEYQTRSGNIRRAEELRAEADALVQEVLKLYNPATGSWNVLHPGGKVIDSRHIYDYLTIGTTISEDLSPRIKTGMMKFMDRELMTPTWMRAMSRQDPSALDSDRSDHGPAGSFTGWPAKAAQATAELGRFGKALGMFHRFRLAFTAAIPQAVELTKVEGMDGLQARASTRAGASFAEVSGSFADVVINTFFGFRPDVEGKAALWQPRIPRGFDGRLRHVHWKDGFYTIVSDKHGLRMEKE